MKLPLSTPNILTGIRILLIPVLVFVFYFVSAEWRYLAAAGIFTIASITDWLDGYLARKWGQMTSFGAFLDPVADKLIVAVALVLLVEMRDSAYLAIPAMIIICREIAVSALREWMAQYSARRGVAVSLVGKVKTTFQMIAIIVLLGNGPADNWFVQLGYVLLSTAAALTLWSMYLYLRVAWPDLSSGMVPTDQGDGER